MYVLCKYIYSQCLYIHLYIYTSLSFLLNKCSLCIRTAVTYLLRVGKDYTMPHNHHFPNSFHIKQSDTKLCIEPYSYILEIMKRITLIFAHMK